MREKIGDLNIAFLFAVAVEVMFLFAFIKLVNKFHYGNRYHWISRTC